MFRKIRDAFDMVMFALTFTTAIYGLLRLAGDLGKKLAMFVGKRLILVIDKFDKK